MNQKPIFVANWKMQLSFSKTIDYCKAHLNDFHELGNTATIICCPSFTALSSVRDLLRSSSIALGAQDCSAFELGPYTGQESAASLAELGCSYCLVGHSEVRQYLHESYEIAAQKVLRLLEHAITPIFCIGETKEDYEQSKTYDSLGLQLKPLFDLLSKQKSFTKPVFIAYEPVWAIGTGMIPSKDHLLAVFQWLDDQCKNYVPSCKLLYGGSVNENNAQTLRSVGLIDGLLIGSASLDFQKFKNIVSLFSQ